MSLMVNFKVGCFVLMVLQRESETITEDQSLRDPHFLVLTYLVTLVVCNKLEKQNGTTDFRVKVEITFSVVYWLLQVSLDKLLQEKKIYMFREELVCEDK